MAQTDRLILIRAGTQDSLVYKQVVEENEYALPDQFGPDDVIIDLGAHVGSFALACLRRGCTRVHCYEPHPANFEMLTANFSTAIPGQEITVYHAAAWGWDGQSRITHEGLSTACPFVTDSDKIPAESVKLESIATILERVEGPIRMVKMDIEGGELAVLNADADWSRVQEVVGELHYLMNEQITDDWCRGRLTAMGFTDIEVYANPFSAEWQSQAGFFRGKR